jgi:hypothetical protein
MKFDFLIQNLINWEYYSDNFGLKFYNIANKFSNPYIKN